MNKEIAKTNFWTWFSVHKTELEAFIVDENRDYTIYDELTEELHKFDELLFAEITIAEDGKYILIITPDGINDGIEPTREIVAIAPQFDNWNIVRFRQPMNEVQLNYDGLEYEAKDIQILYQLDKSEGKAHLQVYIRNMKKNEKKYKALAFLYMDHILGEFNTITKVGHIDFIHLDEDKSIDDSVSLLELRKLIEDKLY